MIFSNMLEKIPKGPLGRKTNMISTQEGYFSSPSGKIAYKKWGTDSSPSVLALHGWLDNLASFEPLLQHLDDLCVVAIDLPGHGKSDHRPVGAHYHFLDWIPDILAVIEALGWKGLSLMGHSLG